MNMQNTPTGCAREALAYAARGWHVFPARIIDDSKRSHVAGKANGGARWGATTDPITVTEYWQRWPGAMLGVTTGPESGFFVIDADTEEGHAADGVGTLRGWIEENGDLPHTIQARTPSGGWHVYFRWPSDLAIRNSQGALAPGIDVRGDGGMVLAPPSVKPGGTAAYSWINPPGMFDLAECPEWLLTKIRTAQVRKLSERAMPGRRVQIDTGNAWADAALRGELADLLAAPQGNRNAALYTAARKLGQIVAGGGLDESDVRARLSAAAAGIGLAPGEIAATIDSGLHAGAQAPRTPKEQVEQRGSKVIHPAPERDSCFYSAASLKGRPVPDRQWLVHDLVPQKTVTLFSGDGGTGKSLLALQLAVAVTAQTAWIGKPVSGGNVIFLSAEDDDDELHRRLDDILRAEGRSYDDVSGLTLRSLAGEDALLAVESQLTPMQSALFEELDRRAAEDVPALIVIDTLADVYPANENDRAKVRQFVGILRGLALKRKCAVMLLAHPSLTGLNSGSGTSGSTAWNNSVRSRLYLSRITDDGYEADPDARVLSTKKANYGRTGGEINLKWEAGVFVAEAQPTGLDALAAGAKGERVFLKLLDAFTAQGRRVNASGGKTYAPKEFAEHPDSEGVTKRAFKAAMDRLLSDGKVRIMTEGPPSRRVSFLGIEP